MVRPVSDRYAQALIAGYKMALLAHIDHPEGMLFYWSGVGELTYNGNTYTGLARLGKISPISYNVSLDIQEIVFELSGIPPQDSKWLTNEIRGRSAEAWLAVLDRKSNVIPDPKKIVSAVLDYPKYAVDQNGTTTIQLIARSGFYTLERGLNEVHSSEDQRRLFPTDTGCDMISELPQLAVIWKPT